MPRSTQQPRKTALPRKDDVIQIRASSEMKAILTRAANLRGQNLSEFVLDSARQQAEDTLLDQRVFFLNDADHAKFVALLDAPAKIDQGARARLRRKLAWHE